MDIDPDAVFDRICETVDPDGRFIRGMPAIGGALPGDYTRDDGEWRLYVRSDLRGIERLAVLAYEVGHHLSRLRGNDHPDAVLAWELGIKLAVELGFTDSSALVEIANRRMLEDARRSA